MVKFVFLIGRLINVTFICSLGGSAWKCLGNLCLSIYELVEVPFKKLSLMFLLLLIVTYICEPTFIKPRSLEYLPGEVVRINKITKFCFQKIAYINSWCFLHKKENTIILLLPLLCDYSLKKSCNTVTFQLVLLIHWQLPHSLQYIQIS